MGCCRFLTITHFSFQLERGIDGFNGFSQIKKGEIRVNSLNPSNQCSNNAHVYLANIFTSTR
jgi:hypothetical protein